MASVRLISGFGQNMVNGRDLDDYFPTFSLQSRVLRVLREANRLHTFYVKIKVHGGGISGQADATIMGIARALEQLDPAIRSAIKSHGWLRRDPRAKERKKSGQPGARKKFQFSKR